jgi:L,D-transpeptidase YcbB
MRAVCAVAVLIGLLTGPARLSAETFTELRPTTHFSSLEAEQVGHPRSTASISVKPPKVEPASQAPAPVEPQSPETVSLPQKSEDPSGFSLPELPPIVVTLPLGNAQTGALIKRLADRNISLHPRLAKRERESILAFYAAREGALLWLDHGRWNAKAKAVISHIQRAHEEGLDASHYPLPIIGMTVQPDSVSDLAEAELKLSVAVVLYARDARGGRLEPSRISSLMTPKLSLPEASAVLITLRDAVQADKALASFHPPHEGYAALKAKLAALRESAPAQPMVKVPLGPTLKIGMNDPRVPLIRARFDLPPADNTAYDERVASVIADFQRENGLPPSGNLTQRTQFSLRQKASPALQEADIIANMERWRWLPAELGTRHIIVNIPAFALKVMDKGQIAHEARVIVGKPETPTPIFSDLMEHVIINPSWHVPPSILKKEFLPKLASDPDYAARRGFEVVRRGDQISVRQPPGERNALGFIKFMFPNDHAVYLHDTPNRNLFSAVTRAFSHGCVRVDQPFQLAQSVLGDGWSENRLRGMIGRGERTVFLKEKLPVHLTYFTLFVDENGTLQSLDDLYGFHQRVRTALKLDL